MDQHASKQPRSLLACLCLVGGILMASPVIGAAQTPSDTVVVEQCVSIRRCRLLSVRPREMAVGVETAAAGLQSLDSLPGVWVYVPPRCVGPRRCPLLVYLHPEWAFPLQFPGAAKYGLIILRVDERELDRAVQQVLRRFAIDPDKIAIAGFSRLGLGAFEVGYPNPGVFSRVAVLSAPFDPTAVATATSTGQPRHPTAEFFTSSGIAEGGFDKAFLYARALQQLGHPVKLALGLRDHFHYPEDYELLARWLHESWTMPLAARAPPVATSLPLLTPQALARWTTFWTRFIAKPESIRTTARQAHLKEIIIPIGQMRPSVVVMDLPALAAKYPAVAADLRAAGLTAEQAEAYRLALLAGQVVARTRWRAELLGQSADTVLAAAFGDIEPSSVTARNAAFIAAHPAELEMLEAVGMWQMP